MTIAPLPLAVRDPVRAHVATERQAAQKKLTRVVGKGVSAMTPGRARELLPSIRAHVRFLDRTDPVAEHMTSPPGPRLWTGEAVMEPALEVAGVLADDVPDRAERDRRLAPVLAELEKLAKRAGPARRVRKPTLPTTKEIPMATERCIVPGHPHHPGGHIIDGPHDAPAAPASVGVVLPGFPLAITPDIAAFESIFGVPHFTAVRKQRALDLARRVLEFPERDRVSLVAALLYRLAMRAARGGAH